MAQKKMQDDMEPTKDHLVELIDWKGERLGLVRPALCTVGAQMHGSNLSRMRSGFV